jgi:hypothetical protein
LRAEPLEDRRLLSVTLNYAGTGNTLSLTEDTPGATAAVVISEPSPTQNLLKIDLGPEQTFSAASTGGVTYQNGSPTISQYATVNINWKAISLLQVTLPGDGLTLGPIRDAVAGISNILASAGTIEVAGIDTSAVNPDSIPGTAVDLRATGNLTIDSGVTVQTGLGTLSLAADVKADGTGDDGQGTLSVLAGTVVCGGSVTLRGAALSIDPTASVGSTTAGWAVRTVAGAVGQIGFTDGPGRLACFQNPNGVAVDGEGNVYVADYGNDEIRKITPAGVVTTLAGVAGQAGSADGTGTAARFNGPWGLAVDSAGNIYVADSNNDDIRKITPAGVVTTLAGVAGASGSIDGVGTAARFYYPAGVTVDGAGIPAASQVTIRSSLPSRPISLGGGDSDVAGINLTDAELARIQTASNTLGTQYIVINNTAGTPITGTFVNLSQGGTISASYGGTTYCFRADYTGGDGKRPVDDLYCHGKFFRRSPDRDRAVSSRRYERRIAGRPRRRLGHLFHLDDYGRQPQHRSNL